MTARIHLAPDRHTTWTPCCLRGLHELPRGDRITSNPARINCPGPGAPQRPTDRIPTDPTTPRRLGLLTRTGRLLRAIVGRR